MKIFRNLLIIGFSLLLFSSCEKTVGDYGDVRKFDESQPLIKINYASPYKDDRLVIVKFNGRRVTSLIQNRTPFPGGGYNTRGDVRADYLTVDPGQVKVTIALPFKKDTGLDSLELYNTTMTIESGKKYVIHFADTAANTKSVLTEENFMKPDSGYAAYRFINLMPNAPAVDLYYGTSATDHTADRLVAGNVGYLTTSNYFTLNRYAARTWKVRAAGAALTTATILASYTSASTLLNQRTYMIYAHGYAGLTTATEKPYVSFFHIR
jgi:acyl carrier protein